MELETLLERWDGETVVARRDSPSGAWIFIAIHSTRLGPAVGGTRMRPYPDPSAALQDALRLSAGMTYKFAVPGLPYGGGKAVIAVPSRLDAPVRDALLRRYGGLVHQLGGLYRTAPDVGTTSDDMDRIAETGAPFVFARTVAAGGAGSSGPATAVGVFAAIQVACEQLHGEASVEGRHVVVQGAGSVGQVLIEKLLAAGARVTFTDVDESAAHRFRGSPGAVFVEPEAVYSVECDLFAPCALGGVLDERTIPRLRCRAVAGGANNQLADPADADRLRARGILYAPDYVANVGGAMAGIGIEASGWTRAEAERKVAESVESSLRRVFRLAERDGVTTDTAARRIADERLASAG